MKLLVLFSLSSRKGTRSVAMISNKSSHNCCFWRRLGACAIGAILQTIVGNRRHHDLRLFGQLA